MPWNQVATGTLSGLTDATVDKTFGTGIPQFFMTGDGHRSPPFGWTMRCNRLKLHFLDLMANGRLCAHVELHQDQVKENSVPGELLPLFNQQKIFGWELAIYKDLQPLMEQSMTLAGDLAGRVPTEQVRSVVAFDRELVRVHALLHQVGNPPGLAAAMRQHEPYRTYYQGRANGQPQNLDTEQQYLQFLIQYHNTAMALRTGLNNYIGTNITRNINLHPNCTHIITCGDAHITRNNLTQYVLIPAAAQGVADAANM